ncbi:MAG: ATP-binding protein [Gammaproteobacteria bacterium]|nr:ATP-binding protein [Gammaproteobacteria bacterium]
MFSRLSLQQSIIGIILIMGVISIALVVMGASAFKQLSIENEQKALTELTKLAVDELLDDLSDRMSEMGSDLQTDEQMLRGLKSNNYSSLSTLLNDQFFQYYTTAGVLKLEKLYVYDKSFRLLAQSSEGYVMPDRALVLCAHAADEAAIRRGPLRVKALKRFCVQDGLSFYSVIIPIGGLVPQAYLQIVVDPSYSIKPLEQKIGHSAHLIYPNGKDAHRPSSWPGPDLLKTYLQAHYVLRDSNLQNVLTIHVARNIGDFQHQIRQTVMAQVALVIIVVLPAVVFSILLLHRAFDPVRRIKEAAQRITKGEYIVVSETSFPEIDVVVNSFNSMIRHISHLIRELEQENDFRREIQIALKENQLRLEQARDEALSASRSKSEFLANMSHEIRTPLTAIIGFAESSLDADQTMAERLEALQTIIRSGRHLLSVINDILDLSKIEAAKLEIERIAFEPLAIVEEVMRLVRIQADEKGLTLKVDFQFPLPHTIINDPLRIKQVLINLCSNAIKFTQEGEICIRVHCEQEKQKLFFDVVDTGIGMTPPQLEKVFDKFAQADSSTSRQYGGTGLGLSLSQQLTELMGGCLSATSTYGEGSCFTASVSTGSLNQVSFIESSDQIVKQKEKAGAKHHGILLSGCILVAEDIEDNQRLLKIYFGRFGNQLIVEFVDNGQQAVDRVSEQNFDLIFMDMQMPVMGGLDATRMIRQKNINTPVIALTANTMREDQERCLAAGCNEFLSKPIDRDALLGVCQKYLQSASADDSEFIFSSLLEQGPEYEAAVEKFIAKLPDYLGSIQQATQAGDTPTAERELHNLKGVAGGMGFSQISQLAAKIEFQIKNQDLDMVLLLVDELKKMSQNVRLK